MENHRVVRTRQRVSFCAHAALAAAICVAAGQAVAIADVAVPAEGGRIDLRAAQVRTTPGTNLLVNGQGLKVGERCVIQLDGPMTAERSAALENAGVKLGGYLPENAWIVKVDDASAASIPTIPFIVWAGAFDNAWKIDPELAARPYSTAGRKSLAGLGLCQVVVVVFEGEQPDAAIGEIMKAGGQVLNASLCGPQWMIDAVMTPAAARGLASEATVQFIEDAPEATPRNDSNRWILQSNVNNQTPLWDRGLHGEGQVAGLIDDTPRESHCMFDDSVAPGSPAHRKFIGWRNAPSFGFHGTHTGGTIAGDAPPYGVYTQHDGIAYAAKISFSGMDAVYDNPSTLQARLEDQHNDGARVHSNSWGDDGTTAYTTWCRQIDLYTWANEDGLVAFAVTNLSNLKTPENSINCFAVGASNDSPSQGNICSGGRGPTSDGRRKPEIFAPGCSTRSADAYSTCDTATATGTSMACPAIAGSALLVRQYYMDGFYPSGAAQAADAFTPSGALIRATMLNGTVDMTGISGFPTVREGWGRLVLDDALYFAGDARKLVLHDVRNAQGLTTGQQAQHEITCASSGQPLRVTLVWTGPAATVGAGNPVINNLDLEVTTPGGQMYRGNDFVSGQSGLSGTTDIKNNVEQVLFASPMVGTYQVRVRGTTVNQGPQGYAVVISGDISEQCDAPVINSQPGAVAVDAGQPAILSVAAEGTGLRYQWRRNGVELENDDHIGGVNGSLLMINPATPADAGSYDVVIGNDCDETVSQGATLTVNSTNPCRADVDGVEGLAVPDIFAFLQLWFSQNPSADWDGADGLGVPDIFAYLSDWFAGC